ncbi:MAG: DUF2231 domain-containing protein [bacterium]
MYTLAHVHLILNHLPIIITGIALLLAAVAAWRRDDYLVRVALSLLVLAALSALPTYLTGEDAEHAVIDMPGVTRELIHDHEDMALIAACVVGALGTFALWALWRYRRPVVIPTLLVRATVVGALIGTALMAYTGLLGGEIRHTEVRSGFVAPARGVRE